jgi:hypothetical protein
LMVLMNCPARAGRMRFKACGKMTRRIWSSQDRPRA